MGAAIRLQGKSYDVDKDFTWAELLDVERLGGKPLAIDASLYHLSVVGAFLYIIRRRSEPQLTWDAFTSEPFDLGDTDDDDDAESEPAGAKPAAKRRPQKA